MAKTKHLRDKKRQLGQFMTPEPVARRILDRHVFRATDRVLEPGFGLGAFLLPLIDRFMELRDGNLAAVLTENVWGIELDEELHRHTLAAIRSRYGVLPDNHNLSCGDFLLQPYPSGRLLTFPGTGRLAQDGHFDLIVGNPPFGATVDVDHQNELDRLYGRRDGLKIKKESYSFFIVKALDLTRVGGSIAFICSDTFLTIPTMKGLRNALMNQGKCDVTKLDEFSPETSYPMVVLRFTRGEASSAVVVDHRSIAAADIKRTENLSWRAGGDFAPYFGGAVLGEYIVASSGMTTGKNEYFVRDIVDGSIEEWYEFKFVEERVTLERELERARLGQISERTRRSISAREALGETRRNVHIRRRDVPIRIRLPHNDYRYYNKAQAGVMYTAPRFAIYWKDEGDAVLTFKRNGNWYLFGVGGAPFFGRECITWRLISSRLDARYLPPGYILDSGAPCAFLRDGVGQDELWFILGWMVSDVATRLLKGVLNHTMNIQSKDVERLPYPSWVPQSRKLEAIARVRELVARARAGERLERNHADVQALQHLYELTVASGAQQESHVSAVA